MRNIDNTETNKYGNNNDNLHDDNYHDSNDDSCINAAYCTHNNDLNNNNNNNDDDRNFNDVFSHDYSEICCNNGTENND